MSENLTPVIPSLYGLTYYELPLGPYQGQNRSDYKMIKYFCDVCEDEVDKSNPLSELTITTKSLDALNTSGVILLEIHVCDNCIEKLKDDPARKFQRTIRGY